MAGRRYRSYVIRSWTTGQGDAPRERVRIERVESGEQVDLEGDAAGLLARAVEDAIEKASVALEPDGSDTAQLDATDPEDPLRASS